MREIVIEDNPLDLQIFIDNELDFTQLPDADYALLVLELEETIAALIDKKRNRKPRTRAEPSQK